MPPKKKALHPSPPTSSPSPPPTASLTPSLSHPSNSEFTKRLSPIYDALDSNSPKSALKLLHSALVKYGRRPLLLALLALTHTRVEQRTEAATLVEEVIATHPTDIHLLATLTLSLKALNQHFRIPSLYTTALSTLAAALPPSTPPPEELLLPLFFAYASSHAYADAQKTAMKLYTHHKQPHYLFFSLLNLLLPLPPTPSPHPLLVLAERMIRRGCLTPTLRADDVEVVGETLRMQGESAREVEWWMGEEGRVYKGVYEEEWWRRVAEAYGRAGWRKKERATWEVLTIKYEADWHYVTRWLQAHVERLDWKPSGQAGEEEEKDDMGEEERLAHVRDVLQQLRADPSNTGGRKRNPHLAAVHLEYLLILRAVANTSSPPDSAYIPLLDQLVEYYRRFGSRPCFFNDCQAYLVALPPALRLELLSRMREVCGPDYQRGQAVSDIERMPLLVSWHQCACFLHAHGELSTEGLEAQCVLYYHHFLLSSALSTSPVSTSRGTGDPFLVLLTSTLYQLHERTSDSMYLFTSTVLLEHALSISPHNFDHSLLLLRLYSHPAIACPARSASIYHALSIKQIQHESLSHLILHDLVRLGLLTSAYSLCGQLQSVHAVYDKDEATLLQLAYEQKRWGKVLELKEMRDRMQRSWGHRWARRERQWMELVRAHSKELSMLLDVMDKHREDDDKLSGEPKDDALHNNADFSVVPCYEPPSSALHAALNRPAPSLLTSFHPLHSPTAITPDSSYPVDDEYVAYLQYKRLVPDLLTSAIRADAASLRTHLASLKAVLTRLGVASFPSFEATNGAVELPATPPTSFHGLHWWLTFLSLEACACVLECKEPTAALLASSNPLNSAELDDHSLRWTSVQRQLSVLTDLLTSLIPYLSTAALHAPQDDQHTVVIGKPISRPFNPSLLSHCSTFLHHAALFLTTTLQLLTTHIPNRKSARKKKKSPPPPTTSSSSSSSTPRADAAGDEGGEEEVVWGGLAGARVGLAGLVRLCRGVLQGVEEVLEGVSGVEVEWGVEWGLLQRCAEVVEEVKGGSGVRGVGDVDSFVSQGVAACVTSWTANAEELSKMTAAYLAALQHIRLS